jgi:hypothetical protein
MKKITFILLCFVAFKVSAQDTQKSYSSFSTEMIFSFADIDNKGNTEGNNLRWAPVINPQWMYNYDLSNSFGIFTGMAIRNVGFIYENPMDSLNNTKYKFRTYNLGIPIGFKVGQTEKFLFFAGYEIEFPFEYKEKEFLNEDKEDKDVIWFSDRVEQVQHSVLAGIQFKHGATLKFKYYLTNFHNRDYVSLTDGVQTKPYDFKANVFYFSLGWDLFTNYKDYMKK